MNRKQFLSALGGAAVCAMVTSAGSASETAVGASFQARRVSHENTGEIAAPPEAVFPLLCPVREYEWIEGWKCELLYTASGVAEEGCIFKTSFPDPLNPMTWFCSRYEPPRRIQYVGMVPGELVMNLNITLEPTAAGTRLSWIRSYTGLTPSGNERVAYWKTEWDRALTEKIDYFLKNGKMLKQAEAKTPGRNL